MDWRIYLFFVLVNNAKIATCLTTAFKKFNNEIQDFT